MDTPPISFTVALTDLPRRQAVDNPPGARERLLAEFERQRSLGAEFIQLAAHLGVTLRAPTEEETAVYGWKPGMEFVFEPADPEVADTVLLTRMIFNWRLVVLRRDMFGFFDILAHWCFHDDLGNAMTFVRAVRELGRWGGRIDAEPEGYIKKLDSRPETPVGRRAR